MDSHLANPERSFPITLSQSSAAPACNGVQGAVAGSIPSLGLLTSTRLETTSSKAHHLGMWRKKLPTITEADCEDDDETQLRSASTSTSDMTATCAARHADLPELHMDPLSLASSDSAAKSMARRLEEVSKADRDRLLAWISKALPDLAMSEAASEVVQKAFDVAKGSERTKLINEFHGYVLLLSESRQGHQVLSNMIQTMPASSIGFIVAEMAGHCGDMARHRYGHIVIEAMTMHCSELQMASLTPELVKEASELSRHPYGSIVIKQLLEYADLECRASIVKGLIPELALLAMHRTASHVIEKALSYGSLEVQQLIATSLLKARAPASVVDIACSRCGSSLLEEISNMKTHSAAFCSQLAKALPRLCHSKFGRRVLASFELTPVTSAKVPSGGNSDHAAAMAA